MTSGGCRVRTLPRRAIGEWTCRPGNGVTDALQPRLETPVGLCDDAAMSKMLSVAGTALELVERGEGRPLMFLHAGEGLAPERPWLELLARRYRVLAPWHPGWGNSALLDGMGVVDDLAYLYLDLAAQLGLDDAVLVGACFGGWVAAEIMVRSTARFSRLVLVDPLGVKILRARRARHRRHARAASRRVHKARLGRPGQKGEVEFTALPDSELAAIVHGR